MAEQREQDQKKAGKRVTRARGHERACAMSVRDSGTATGAPQEDCSRFDCTGSLQAGGTP
jgi:hypothetical protein